MQNDYNETNAKYVQAVENFNQSNRVKPGCCSAHYDESGNAPDPFFSWRACECCQRSLGGNRETYQFATVTGETFDADICTDCVYFAAYGKLDDMTMMEIEL
jgi:hypothetical protein